MLITVTRSGGFTGREKLSALDTSGRADAADLEELAKRAVAPVADGFRYRITVDDEVLDLQDPCLSDAQRTLIRTVLGTGA
ncbi:protealysin inhibitor emfourin [Streptomyces sp. NRRL F-2664]|uniref:protealysin inhibitor emfourin n=1 Tax=Streptomyces sp. NRRL F-2664 TaxID=1463842 RepID=UPI0004C711E7|nr:protealysin inhibitor emfourin [Streptomyces sp. NRRL F-2664]